MDRPRPLRWVVVGGLALLLAGPPVLAKSAAARTVHQLLKGKRLFLRIDVRSETSFDGERRMTVIDAAGVHAPPVGHRTVFLRYDAVTVTGIRERRGRIEMALHRPDRNQWRYTEESIALDRGVPVRRRDWKRAGEGPAAGPGPRSARIAVVVDAAGPDGAARVETLLKRVFFLPDRLTDPEVEAILRREPGLPIRFLTRITGWSEQRIAAFLEQARTAPDAPSPCPRSLGAGGVRGSRRRR